MPVLPALRTRQLGGGGRAFTGDLLAAPGPWATLAPAPVRDATWPGAAPLNWLDLDPSEGRFLLAAGGDGSVVAYDVGGTDGLLPSPEARAAKRARGGGGGGGAGAAAAPPQPLPPLFHARRGGGGGSGGSAAATGGHTASVAGVQWYPVDAGAFVSAGADGCVKLWDANAGPSPVVSLRLGGRGPASAAAAASPSAPPPPPRAHCVAMSPIATAHALVAVGCGGGGAAAPGAAPSDGGAPLRLADPAGAGAITHHLPGHAGAVWAASWSPRCEWTLVTGGADGGVRVWDVRRAAACVRCLDGSGRGGRATRRRARAAHGAGAAPPPDDNASLRPRGRFTAPASAASIALSTAAHDGPVTGLTPSSDGLHWVSAGTDGVVRVWEAATDGDGGPGPGGPLPWSLPGTHNAARRPRQLAVGGGPAPVLFHPSGSVVQVLPLPGGAGRGAGAAGAGGDWPGPAASAPLLRGHVSAVHACAWSEGRRELYTGGDDRALLVWSPSRLVGGGRAGEGEEGEGDAWSDEDLVE